MCGIVGYVGSNSSQDVLLGGLRRLEYRGYDSAGIAVVALFAAALPVVTAVFARVPATLGWIRSGPPA